MAAAMPEPALQPYCTVSRLTVEVCAYPTDRDGVESWGATAEPRGLPAAVMGCSTGPDQGSAVRAALADLGQRLELYSALLCLLLTGCVRAEARHV